MYQQVIDVLNGAKRSVGKLLTERDDEHHRLKIEFGIQQLIEYLALLTQTGDIQPVKNSRLPPATTIAGKPIAAKQPVRQIDLAPAVDKLRNFRLKVETTYDAFLSIESIDILRNYEDGVIRGVAKKAKMNVTKEDPEKITLEFIEEIKANIRELNQMEASRLAEIELNLPSAPADVISKVNSALEGSDFVNETIVPENDTNSGNSETPTETAQSEPTEDQSAAEDVSGNSETAEETAQDAEGNEVTPAPLERLPGESNNAYKKRLREHQQTNTTR